MEDIEYKDFAHAIITKRRFKHIHIYWFCFLILVYYKTHHILDRAFLLDNWGLFCSIHHKARWRCFVLEFRGTAARTTGRQWQTSYACSCTNLQTHPTCPQFLSRWQVVPGKETTLSVPREAVHWRLSTHIASYFRAPHWGWVAHDPGQACCWEIDSFG